MSGKADLGSFFRAIYFLFVFSPISSFQGVWFLPIMCHQHFNRWFQLVNPQNCVSINIPIENTLQNHVTNTYLRRAFRWRFRKFQLKYTKKLHLRLQNQVPVQMMTTELGELSCGGRVLGGRVLSWGEGCFGWNFPFFCRGFPTHKRSMSWYLSSTFTIQNPQKCRVRYHTLHGSYGWFFSKHCLVISHRYPAWNVVSGHRARFQNVTERMAEPQLPRWKGIRNSIRSMVKCEMYICT